jgi:hypothetical protein
MYKKCFICERIVETGKGFSNPQNGHVLCDLCLADFLYALENSEKRIEIKEKLENFDLYRGFPYINERLY